MPLPGSIWPRLENLQPGSTMGQIDPGDRLLPPPNPPNFGPVWAFQGVPGRLKTANWSFGPVWRGWFNEMAFPKKWQSNKKVLSCVAMNWIALRWGERSWAELSRGERSLVRSFFVRLPFRWITRFALSGNFLKNGGLVLRASLALPRTLFKTAYWFFGAIWLFTGRFKNGWLALRASLLFTGPLENGLTCPSVWPSIADIEKTMLNELKG